MSKVIDKLGMTARQINTFILSYKHKEKTYKQTNRRTDREIYDSLHITKSQLVKS